MIDDANVRIFFQLSNINPSFFFDFLFFLCNMVQRNGYMSRVVICFGIGRSANGKNGRRNGKNSFVSLKD